MSLNSSKHYRGENISGRFQLTVEPDNPLSLITDLTGSVFQLIVKKTLQDEDENALANLTLGQGLTIITDEESSQILDFEIPGSSTSSISSENSRTTIVEIHYELNVTYPNKISKDVLEIGKIKIETARVLKNL